MKKLLVLASFVLAAASPAFAAEPSTLTDHDLVAFGAKPHARVGMSRAEIAENLGAPSVKLADNVWAYWDFRTNGGPGPERGNALIVVFTQERVSLMRFTTRAAVEVALQKARAAAAASTVAKK